MPAVSTQLNDFILPAAPRPAATMPSPLSWLSRVMNALANARTQQAEREIARLIEHRGGRFNDSLEREIERHFI